MDVHGMDDRPVWAQRLRQARQARFSTTWLAARTLHQLDPQRLPSARALHRYWAERWETGRIRPNRSYRELIELLLKAPGLFGEPPFVTYPPLPQHVVSAQAARFAPDDQPAEDIRPAGDIQSADTVPPAQPAQAAQPIPPVPPPGQPRASGPPRTPSPPNLPNRARRPSRSRPSPHPAGMSNMANLSKLAVALRRPHPSARIAWCRGNPPLPADWRR